MSKARKAPRAPKVRPTYWHGGAAGRTVGDSILPAIQVPEMKLIYSKAPKEVIGPHDPNFAYVTTNQGLAFNFAVRHAQVMGEASAVYRVESRKLLPDPDYPPGVSFRCRTAVVLEIVGSPIIGDEPLSVQGLQEGTWQDGTPLYDSQGYPLPNELQKKFGITPADLRALGIGAPITDILRKVSQVIQIKNPGITQEDIIAADPKFSLSDARKNFSRIETATQLLARSRRQRGDNGQTHA